MFLFVFSDVYRMCNFLCSIVRLVIVDVIEDVCIIRDR